MKGIHVIFFVLLKVLPYNGYEVVCFRNIFFTFPNIIQLFMTSGNALKETPMERLHTFPKVLICGIIVVVGQKKCCEDSESLFITFQSLGDIIIGCAIAEFNIGMLIHKEPSITFFHASRVQALQMMAS